MAADQKFRHFLISTSGRMFSVHSKCLWYSGTWKLAQKFVQCFSQSNCIFWDLKSISCTQFAIYLFVTGGSGTDQQI